MAAPREPQLPSLASPPDASAAVLDNADNVYAAGGDAAAPGREALPGWLAGRLPKPQQACTPTSASKGGDSPAVLGIANLLAKYPKHSRRLRELDANADGVLDEDEVEAALRDLVDAEAQNRMLRWIVLGLSVLSVLLVFATVGVAVAAAVVSKDTAVTTTSLLVDKDTGFAVAVGPCAVRTIPVSKAIEEATAPSGSGTGRRQRVLMASSSSADVQDSNVYVADGAAASGAYPEAAAVLPMQGLEASGGHSSSVRRQLQQSASAYGWVNGYLTHDSYALDATWLLSNGLSRFSRVLVVGSDTSLATIDALVSQVSQWCPNLSGVTPSTQDPYGFFLTTFYCKIVKTSQAESTGVPTSFSCGCRLAIARTTCPETSDPARKVDLSCAQDTGFFLDVTANAVCQVLSYRCPATVAVVDSLIATGKAVFGDPGWTTTSGGSIEESISTIDLVSESESRRRQLLGSEGGSAGARRLTQWDTDPGSVTLVITTTNTQSTWG